MLPPANPPPMKPPPPAMLPPANPPPTSPPPAVVPPAKPPAEAPSATPPAVPPAEIPPANPPPMPPPTFHLRLRLLQRHHLLLRLQRLRRQRCLRHDHRRMRCTMRSEPPTPIAASSVPRCRRRPGVGEWPRLRLSVVASFIQQQRRRFGGVGWWPAECAVTCDKPSPVLMRQVPIVLACIIAACTPSFTPLQSRKFAARSDVLGQGRAGDGARQAGRARLPARARLASAASVGCRV